MWRRAKNCVQEGGEWGGKQLGRGIREDSIQAAQSWLEPEAGLGGTCMSKRLLLYQVIQICSLRLLYCTPFLWCTRVSESPAKLKKGHRGPGSSK